MDEKPKRGRPKKVETAIVPVEEPTEPPEPPEPPEPQMPHSAKCSKANREI